MLYKSLWHLLGVISYKYLVVHWHVWQSIPFHIDKSCGLRANYRFPCNIFDVLNAVWNRLIKLSTAGKFIVFKGLCILVSTCVICGGSSEGHFVPYSRLYVIRKLSQRQSTLCRLGKLHFRVCRKSFGTIISYTIRINFCSTSHT